MRFRAEAVERFEVARRRDRKNRTALQIAPGGVRGPVKAPVRGLNQTPDGVTTIRAFESVQRVDNSCLDDIDRAVARLYLGSGPIVISVRALYQSAIRLDTVPASEVKRIIQRACGAHCIEDAIAAGPAVDRGSIQVAIFCLNRGSFGKRAVRSAVEVVDRFEAACRGDLKDCAISGVFPAQCGRPVK